MSNGTQRMSIIDPIFADFKRAGHLHYGENVTQQAHMLQCATFARRQGEDALMVAAALLHDYGHLLHDQGEEAAEHGIDTHHEECGAEALAPYFVDQVIAPIRLHVAAKRYLCAMEPAYHEQLSAASRQSLALQGGPMSTEEVRRFEAMPHFRRALCLRRLDELGKEADMATPALEDFRPELQQALRPEYRG